MESGTKDKIILYTTKFVTFVRNVVNKIFDLVEYGVIRLISLFPNTNEEDKIINK